jgi:hypothetical protein
VKTKVIIILLFLFALLGTGLAFKYFSYVFARHVHGVIVGIDRVTQPSAIVSGSPVPPSQLFSFAVAVKEASGDIFTSSSEDRQWALVEKGNCVDAKFFPYPPWQIDKAGTYFGARLLKLYPCSP